MSTPTYYRPYSSSLDTSSSDSSSDSEIDTDVSDDFTNSAPNFAGFASNLSMASGPNFITSNTSNANTGLDFLTNRSVFGSPYDLHTIQNFANLTITPDSNAGLLKTQIQSINNIIMLNSTDRDLTAYDQPTNMVLRLPREYTNVTNFQIQQIKLLSSFFYFRTDKQNTDITIYELGRYDSNNRPIKVKSFIREGTYNINTLLTELQIQLNYTPIFYDYQNGFSDFAQKFAATGDYSLNFNMPGDYYFDSLLNIYIPQPTMSLIVSKYFQTPLAGLTSYSTQQLKVAYYYPVLKEILLDSSANMVNLAIVTSIPYLLPTETVTSRCVHTFQGLNDPVVLEVIDLNIVLLDDYRISHTFRTQLINKYVATYEQQSNRIKIYSPSLNTSLVMLLTTKYNQFFSQELADQGITAAQLAALKAQNTTLLAVITDIYFFIQRWLATYFGIQFNSYTIDYIANPSYTVGIRDAVGASNISVNYDAKLVAQNIVPIDSNIVGYQGNATPHFWPRMYNLSNAVVGNSQVAAGLPEPYVVPYDTINDVKYNQYGDENRFVSSNLSLYTNKLYHLGEACINISNAQYNLFQFKSDARQTLQIDTFARPLKYRYPPFGFNPQGPDLSYNFNMTDNNFNIFNIRTDTAGYPYPFFLGPADPTFNFGINYINAYSQWDFNSPPFISISPAISRVLILSEYPPVPPDAVTLDNVYYKLTATFVRYQTVGEGNPIDMFYYADFGALMADVSANFTQSPINYKQRVAIPANAQSASITFVAYVGRPLYLFIRPQTTTTIYENFRIVLSFPQSTNYYQLSTDSNIDIYADPQAESNLSNFYYASVAGPDYIDLPISPALQFSNPCYDALYAPLSFSNYPMGYDSNQVSTNFTDYLVLDDSGNFININTWNNEFRSATGYDPINQYGMVIYSNDNYKPATQNYITPTSATNIFTLRIINNFPSVTNYTPVGLGRRQTSIVYWWDNYYIPNSIYQAPMDGLIQSNILATPFTSSISRGGPLAGYSYNGSNSAIQMGQGIIALSVVPGEGVWSMDRFMFKSVYVTNDPLTDENLQIKYLGVFNAIYVATRSADTIVLSDAITVMSNYTHTVYSNADPAVFGGMRDGTYYEFVRDTTYVTNSIYKTLNGYSQQLSTFNNDMHAIYSVVPFDGSGNILTYQGIAGSPVPYPFFSDASNGTFYYDGHRTIPVGTAEVGNGISRDIFVPVNTSNTPQYGPQAGYDQTQFQVQQSTPIGTTLQQFIEPFNLFGDAGSNSFSLWSGLGLTNQATIITDVDGYILKYDGGFQLYSYEKNTSSRNFTYISTFTADQVFASANAAVTFLGVAANDTEYAFFSYSNASIGGPDPIPVPPPGFNPYGATYPSSAAVLIIRKLNPLTGIMTEHTQTSPLLFEYLEVQSIKYNNYGGFCMGLAYLTTTFAFCQHGEGDVLSMIRPPHTLIIPRVIPPANTHIVVAQATNEQNGVFYAFFLDSLKQVLSYSRADPTIFNISVNIFYEYQALSYRPTLSPIPRYCQLTTYNFNSVNNLFSPIVSRIGYNEEVLFSGYNISSPAAEVYLYKVVSELPSIDSRYSYIANIQQSVFSFPTSLPTTVYSGGGGAKWWVLGNTIYGNRNDIVDAPTGIGNAWQIFYPTQRIVLTQLSRNFTYMNDLSSVGIYNEYPHTNVFVYPSLSNCYADISSEPVFRPDGGGGSNIVGGGQMWGMENSSNYIAAAVDFRGYGFNSFLLAAQLQSNAEPYVIAVRNYSPTEISQVMLRVSLPNRYDFGYVTFRDLSNEPVLYQSQAGSFGVNYATVLNGFNSNFIFDSNGHVFGSNQVLGYNGSNFSNVTGFGDLYTQFVSLYETYNSNVSLINTINSNVAANLSNFIANDLSNIIPASAQNRQKYTDPLMFTILWQSALSSTNLYLDNEWGLGWNLGYAKADMPFDTAQTAQSFYKILDDYINLRLNEELDINRIDTTGQENINLTKDPQGIIKAFHGKLLLAPFGSYAQTLVSNPIAFNPPLGRLDKIKFQWLNVNNTVIDNSDCEWNMVVQIVEQRTVALFSAPPLINPVQGGGYKK
jgi:hypothetical protein